MTTSGDLLESSNVDTGYAQQVIGQILGIRFAPRQDVREGAFGDSDPIGEPALRRFTACEPDSNCAPCCFCVAHGANDAPQATEIQELSFPAKQHNVAYLEPVANTALTCDDAAYLAMSDAPDAAKIVQANVNILIAAKFPPGLSQRKIALAIKIHHTVLSRVRNHAKKLSLDALEQLATGLGQTASELLTPDLYDAGGQKRTLTTGVGVPSGIERRHGKTSSTHAATSRKASSNADPSLSRSALTLGDLEGLQVKLSTATHAIAAASSTVEGLINQTRLAQSRAAHRRGRGGQAH